MYTKFNDISSLMEAVKKDKQADGVDSSTYKRYPIRFVLFDNFKDSYLFTKNMIQEQGVKVKHVQDWFDPDYPDVMIKHHELASKIEKYIHSLNGKDMIITPFSELARFYDNNKHKEFDTLINTLKTIETTDAGWEKQQRVYLPIVGLEGKMFTFYNDCQTIIWYMPSSEEDLGYHLISTFGTDYGVKNLAEQYTIKSTMLDWLEYWKDADSNNKRNIICTSKAIYPNAEYAQPDNAFTYCVCDSVYDFLTRGLNLKMLGLEYRVQDEEYWQHLAQEIDLQTKFDFDNFFAKYFSVNTIASYKTFIKLWFEHNDGFSRWLLTNTLKKCFDENEYIRKIVVKMTDFSNRDLFSCIALEFPINTIDIETRRYCLAEAANRSVILPDDIQHKLISKLEEAATQTGYSFAASLFSPISIKEKELAVTWLGEGKINRDDIKAFYPELYYYMDPAFGTLDASQKWILDYIDHYKKAKISDIYTNEVDADIKKYNANEVEFVRWYNCFKTTRSNMASRTDIDIFYWIDGLGIDWIPLISHLIAERENDKIYLNDVKIARSILPTVTEVNKHDLEKLQSDQVVFAKMGDIDALAHKSTNTYPSNIVAELDMVKKAINEILTLYAGKKIAIVSDHGLSYLSQKQPGLNLKGFEFHHSGRYAVRISGTATKDENYHLLDSSNTACALNHKSLGAKIPSGLGIHGGCTPEEVLVPILIISSCANSKTWKATFLQDVISGTDPVVHLTITGLSSLDSIKIEYAGKQYNVKNIGGNSFDSDSIDLKDGDNDFTLWVGSIGEPKKIIVNTGTKEDDLFADFGF